MKKIAVLVAILILASFFRLYKLAEIPPGLYPDEAVNGNNAVEALETGRFKVFYPENNGREGLFINLQALAIAAFGAEPWVLRLVSAIFGILTVFGMYLLTSELLGEAYPALFGALAVALSFWHINFSRIGFRAVSEPFFLIFGFYFLIRALRSLPDAKTGSGRVSCLAIVMLAGIFFGLGFYTYISYRIVPLLILILLALLWRQTPSSEKRNFFEHVLIGAAALMIAALPIGLYFLRNPNDFFGRALQVSALHTSVGPAALNIAKTLGMFTFMGDWNWRHNVAGWPLLFPPVGALFLIGFFWTIREVLRKRSRALAECFALAWFFIMLSSNFLATEGSPHALRALAALPAVFLITVFGGRAIWGWLTRRSIKTARLTLAAFIVLLIVFTAWQYFVYWGGNAKVYDAFSGNYAAEAQYLKSLPREVPKYVILNALGVDVRGMPAPAETIVFLTGGWNETYRTEHNIHFVREDGFENLQVQPPAMFILMRKSDEWAEKLKARFTGMGQIVNKQFSAFSI